MSEVNKSIVVQSCAKIAGDMASSLHSDDIADVLRAWRIAFKEVCKSVNEEIGEQHPSKSTPRRGGAGGRSIPMTRSQDEIKNALEGARGQQKIMHTIQEPTAGSHITSNMFDFNLKKK